MNSILYNTYCVYCDTDIDFYWLCLRLFMRGCELAGYVYVWDRYRLMELPWDSAWTWWLTFLGVDFCYYWVHRFAHGTKTRLTMMSTQLTLKQKKMDS